MALDQIQIVRLRIGDTEKSIFYPLLSDEEIEYFLLSYSNNIWQASKQAALAAWGILVKIPIRERVGDVEVWNNVSKEYGNFLQTLIKDPSTNIYNTIAIPYAAGISWDDLLANYNNSDVVKSKLAMLEVECVDEIIL